MRAVVDIDGAHGEGGGQLVRMAAAISAVTGVPVRLVNIRAKRRRPGLAAQHAAAVRAVAALCDARCRGGFETRPYSPTIGSHCGAIHEWPLRQRSKNHDANL